MKSSIAKVISELFEQAVSVLACWAEIPDLTGGNRSACAISRLNYADGPALGLRAGVAAGRLMS